MQSEIKVFTLKVGNWTSEIQGRTNTHQNSSRDDAALKEDFEFFVFFNVCHLLAQAFVGAYQMSSRPSASARLDCR